MAKDPAFLFYPGDWLGGTMGMTFEQKGAYIDLLMLQFNRGHMSEHMIGQTVGQLWDTIQDKFIKDDNGLWFNERLDLEKHKRMKYSESRRNNKKGNNQYSKKVGHMSSHMENENRDVNTIIITNDNIGELKNNFSMKGEVGKLLKTTSEAVESLLDEFIQEQISKGDFDRSLKDLRKHFVSWSKIEYRKQKQNNGQSRRDRFAENDRKLGGKG